MIADHQLFTIWLCKCKVSFINWWAGSFELPALAKLAVVFTIASKADFCGYL